MTKTSFERTYLSETSALRFLSRPGIALKLRKYVAILFLLQGVAVFAAAPSPEPLELSDGRTFEAWSVIRQTDDTITIRHAKGAAKIAKELLPPEVLAHYPIVTPRPPEVAILSLPPEPQGLDKPTKGERSI